MQDVVSIIRKSGPSAREHIYHLRERWREGIALNRSSEGSPIRLGEGGIQHCCTIAAALSRFLHYWDDYYLDCHHCSFLVSFHLRRKVQDVSVQLLGVVELVVCRKVDQEQSEQDRGRRI